MHKLKRMKLKIDLGTLYVMTRKWIGTYNSQRPVQLR